MTQTITLGQADYAIAPIKFKTLRSVLPLFTQIGIDETGMDAMAAIITAGIAAARPDFTRDAFDDLAPTFKQLQAAVNLIAVASGLDVKSPASGEAQAASPSHGATSTG